MKQTILTLILCITSLTLTFAQEKQNDAAWEETIGFLKEYLPQFSNDFIALDKCKDIISQRIQFTIDDTKIYKKTSEEGVVIFGNNSSSALYAKNYELKLLEIDSVSISESGIKLHATDKYVLENNKKRNSSYLFLNLSYYFAESYEFCNKKVPEAKYNFKSEKVQRLYKALNHLAYLAREKKKKNKF
ncbi:hypothetical protein [Algibacter pacificus]|uniref:hypothetical protein n=1 Tax=Algibacter pacificus TaxID=2599389 RepID=UPI0011CCDF1C|nr:hypothetical protein [Algibacter pacificus]